MLIADVDFRKAFNFVNHSILFCKLIKSGFVGRAINLLRDMYSKIKARIKVGNRLFQWIYDECGTNQGGPMSPTMFRKMLHDLRTFLTVHCGIVLNDEEILVHILWADDLILMSDSAKGLQNQLDGLFKFCSQYQLIVNSLKTKVMIFGKTNEQSFTFNGSNLEICNQYKYLGVVFNSISRRDGNPFREMVKYTADKALKACFVALNKCKSLGDVTPKISLQMFDSFVLPVLEYGCEIWADGKQKQALESIQLKYLKRMLRVKDSTCTVAVYAETGRSPLWIRQKVRVVKYWLRLAQLNDCKLIKQAYLAMKNLDDIGYVTWLGNVRSILQKCNLEQYYVDVDSLTKEDVSECINQLKLCLYSRFEEDCIDDLRKMPVLRTYVKYKTDFRLENYLLLIRDKKLRNCLSRLRLSSHELAIEKGRHTKPKTNIQDRLCIFCRASVIEDEIHMIVKCDFYKKEREMLYSKISDIVLLTHVDDDEDFAKIMSCKDTMVLFSLAKFVSKCFKKRKLAG